MSTAAMNEPKPFASLSSGLLARKGQAKPAMRPQGFGSFGAQSTGFDDLGWNDMGHDRPHGPVALTPMGADADVEPVEADIVPFHADFEPEFAEAEEPVVLQQRGEIARSFEAEVVEEAEQGFDELGQAGVEDDFTTAAVPEPVDGPYFSPLRTKPVHASAPVTPAPQVAPVQAPGTKARAAFTLRLDQDRHLKLRLASAVTRRSAQALVVEALDQYLANNPAVAGLSLPSN